MRKHRLHKKNIGRARTLAGFSLIELLAVLAILVVVGCSLSILFTQAVESYVKIRAQQEVADTARTIIHFLTRDIENAFVSNTDNRFTFLGTNTTINTNAFLETLAGPSEIVELGYRRDAGLNHLIRRLQTGASIPDADVTTGGTDSIVAENVLSFDIVFVYDDTTATLQTTGAWDSRIDNFANADRAGNNKSPDALPHMVDISFSLRDSNARYPARTFTTRIVLPKQ